jgi:hypothetical protein
MRLKQNSPVKTLINRRFSPLDASLAAASGRLIGRSVGPAGLRARAEGRKRCLASCHDVRTRCCAHRASQSTAQYNPVVPSATEDPEWNRLDSLWRHALLSPHAHSSRISVSGDGCAVRQRARDAQRTLWPFHLTSLLQRRERGKTICGAVVRRDNLNIEAEQLHLYHIEVIRS